MTSIFLDTNIPMYAGGAEHPLKGPCLRVLELVSLNPSAFLTDSEVFQEILHRYLSIRRWQTGRDIFNGFAVLMADRIAPVTLVDVSRAARMAEDGMSLDARDLLHASIMQRFGVGRIVTTDEPFGTIPGIERLDPMRVDEWRTLVTSDTVP